MGLKIRVKVSKSVVYIGLYIFFLFLFVINCKCKGRGGAYPRVIVSVVMASRNGVRGNNLQDWSSKLGYESKRCLYRVSFCNYLSI